MSERKIVVTKDGTTTIQLTANNEHYHSIHGALDEARYVFIKNGLAHYLSEVNPEKINILEVGFGTGLNSLLTFLEGRKSDASIYYTGIEVKPVSLDEITQLNYPQQLSIPQKEFIRFHEIAWEETIPLSNKFSLFKWKTSIEEADFNGKFFDIVYFDAFGFRTHPEIWHKNVLEKIIKQMNNDAIFVTYSAMGQLRRDLISCGLCVEKLTGPPGKREMIRATKKQ